MGEGQEPAGEGGGLGGAQDRRRKGWMDGLETGAQNQTRYVFWRRIVSKNVRQRHKSKNKEDKNDAGESEKGVEIEDEVKGRER